LGRTISSLCADPVARWVVAGFAVAVIWFAIRGRKYRDFGAPQNRANARPGDSENGEVPNVISGSSPFLTPFRQSLTPQKASACRCPHPGPRHSRRGSRRRPSSNHPAI
jgi:hypothetical protein